MAESGVFWRGWLAAAGWLESARRGWREPEARRGWLACAMGTERSTAWSAVGGDWWGL